MLEKSTRKRVVKVSVILRLKWRVELNYYFTTIFFLIDVLSVKSCGLKNFMLEISNLVELIGVKFGPNGPNLQSCSGHFRLKIFKAFFFSHFLD